MNNHIEFNQVTWYSKLLAAVMFLGGLPILAFIIGSKYQEVVTLYELPPLQLETQAQTKSAFSSGSEFTDVLNGTYNIDDERVMLSNGHYQNTIGQGASQEIISAFGQPTYADLNSDGRNDAIFLVSKDGGGTGLFTYVVAAVNKGDGEYLGTAGIFLGDRISPQNINISGGIAVVTYADRKPGEPFTAEPTVGVSKYFKIIGDELVEVSK